MIYCKISIYLPLYLMVIFGTSLISGTGPRVSTKYGDIVGERFHFSEDKYLNYNGYFNHFKGIPYAQPPVGDLRFRPPEEMTAPWTGDYNARYYRSGCPQGTTGNSEDCLYLNVLVPAKNLTDAAVLIWLHGGTFIAGSGALLNNWGVPLLAASDGDFIYVTCNYRLGVLGFLATGDDASSGNYGLMDQRMVLQWVQENIRAFGGDPEKVTLGGISAGSGSVSSHLLSASSRNLFQRAILQSGSMFDSSAMIELNISRAIDANKQVASILGCGTESSIDMVECMRNANVEDILAATREVEERFSGPRRSPVFYPVIDGKFISDSPSKIINEDKFNKVDVILGGNEDEGSYWLDYIYEEEELERDYPPFMNQTYFKSLLSQIYRNENYLYVDSVEQEYTDWKNSDNPEYNYINPWIQISTDELFQCPTDVTARVLSGAGRNVYRYVNTHIPSRHTFTDSYRPRWLGVSHADELPLVFGWHFNTEFEAEFIQTEEEILISVQVMRYWTNFIKTGNPNTPEDVATTFEPWPRFTLPGLEYKNLSPDMENDRAVDARECSFWANYIPKLSLFTDDISELERDWRNSYYDWKYVALSGWQTAFDKYRNEERNCT